VTRAPIQGPEWQGAASPPPQTQTQTLPDLSLLRAKNGLDNGVHFNPTGRLGARPWRKRMEEMK